MRPFIPLTILAVLAFFSGCTPARGSWTDDPWGTLPPQVFTKMSSDRADPELPLVKPRYTDLKKHTHHTDGFSWGVDVSLDGKTMVYASTFNTENPEIFIKDVDGRNPRNISQHVASDIQPRISPDGKSVAFASDRSGNWDIWIIPADGAGPCQQVTESQNDELYPCWSPDGRSLIYSKKNERGAWEMWVTNRQTLATAFIGEGRAPDWGTQNMIVFEKPREAEPRWYAIWTIQLIIDTKGNIVSQEGPVCRVDGGSQWAAISPSWSPDGTKISFTAVSRSPKTKSGSEMRIDDIWIADIKNGRYFQLTQSESPDWSSRWATDGRIYFTAFIDNGHNIWSTKPTDLDMDFDEAAKNLDGR
jgi:dipeptidyl aminopeptidase/acylaminoacyl peptidase